MESEQQSNEPGEAQPSEAAERGGIWGRLKGFAAGRRDRAERNWRFLDNELQRTRLISKVIALHLRYTFGYLAFGFLISAPIQLGLRHDEGWGEGLLKSIALGVLFAIPSLVFWPFSIIDWGRMRIPEFKNLELALTRWAAVVAALWLLISFAVEKVVAAEGWLGWLCDVKVAWTNLGLMFFSWVRVKFHTIMFREFYTLKPEDDLVLRVPPSRLRLFGDKVEKPGAGAVPTRAPGLGPEPAAVEPAKGEPAEPRAEVSGPKDEASAPEPEAESGSEEARG